MNSKHTRKTKANAHLELAVLRRDFFSRLLVHIRMPAGQNPNPPMVCWLDAQGRLNHLRVHAFMQTQACAPYRPFIPRIAINHYGLQNPGKIVGQMGWEQLWRATEPRWSFELSLLPGELADFAPWIASLAEAHAASDSALVAAPPHQCHFWTDRNGGILDCRYAWSAAAWRNMERFEKKTGSGRFKRNRNACTVPTVPRPRQIQPGSKSTLPERRTDNPMKRYANAEKVLPRDLFEKVQKHHTGILWVPARSRFYKERRQLVIALRLQGIESREIAVLAGVTPRRVNQILAAHRQAVGPGGQETVSAK